MVCCFHKLTYCSMVYYCFTKLKYCSMACCFTKWLCSRVVCCFIKVAEIDVFRPESLWDAARLAVGVSNLGALLVDQVSTY